VSAPSCHPALPERVVTSPEVHADERKIYDTPAVVRVGDSVLSTCYFDNPKASAVMIGTKNDNELCHMLVLAYPAHALVDNAWSVENNSCAGAQP